MLHIVRQKTAKLIGRSYNSYTLLGDKLLN